MNRIGIAGIIVFVIILVSCDNGPGCTKNVMQSELDGVSAEQLGVDNAIIDDYIIANNLGPVSEVNGIRYLITKEGSGITPCFENRISFTYIGRFLNNGKIFDSSLNDIEFKLEDLILGWRLCLPSFPLNTNVTIFIPSGYGYGPPGRGSIPPNANLIFNFQLNKIR